MPDASDSLHRQFQSWITHRYFVRVHMTLMLSAVVLSGVLASGVMHAAGVRWIFVRYPIAIVLSYLVFFLLVRLWLAYAMRARAGRSPSVSGNWLPDGDLPGGSLGGSSGGASGWGGGGGKFGGGGASASFENGAPVRAVAMPISQPVPASGGGGSGHGGGGGGGGFDLDDDGLMILLVFIVAVVGIVAAGIILVVHAPVILSEAAFQAALAAGLVKASRDMHREGWVESVFKQTVFPFAIAFVGSVAFGWVAFRHCPSGTTLGEVFRTCVFK